MKENSCAADAISAVGITNPASKKSVNVEKRNTRVCLKLASLSRDSASMPRFIRRRSFASSGFKKTVEHRAANPTLFMIEP